jgi:hypothetical protein
VVEIARDERVRGVPDGIGHGAQPFEGGGVAS